MQGAIKEQVTTFISQLLGAALMMQQELSAKQQAWEDELVEQDQLLESLLPGAVVEQHTGVEEEGSSPAYSATTTFFTQQQSNGEKAGVAISQNPSGMVL